MELDRYLRMLVHYWFIPALLAAVGAFGTFGYLQWSSGGLGGQVSWAGAGTATATVAVLEPAVTRALSGQQAQINFASVAESQTVAERVSRRLGLDGRTDVAPGRMSVKLARTLVPSVPTPLYYIQVQHGDPKWAMAMLEAYVEESRALFIELNALDPGQVDAALQTEEDRIRAELARSRVALRAFEDANDAWRLPSQIDTQAAFVNILRQTARARDIGGATAATTRTDVERSLATAQSELVRLRGLQPEYERLSLEVTLATSALTQLSTRESDLALTNNVAALEAVRNEMAAARLRLARARDALTAYQQANNISDLATELASRAAVVTDLRRQVATSNGTIVGLEEVIAAEEAELRRMRSLLPDYEQLATPVQTAEAKLGQLQLRKVDIVIAGSLPPGVLIKVLDAPHLQSNVAWALILYALGIVLGLSIGLGLVYFVGYFDRTPESAEQVEELVGAPVLARISRAH